MAAVTPGTGGNSQLGKMIFPILKRLPRAKVGGLSSLPLLISSFDTYSTASTKILKARRKRSKDRNQQPFFEDSMAPILTTTPQAEAIHAGDTDRKNENSYSINTSRLLPWTLSLRKIFQCPLTISEDSTILLKS